MIDHTRPGQKWIVEEFYKLEDLFNVRAVMFGDEIFTYRLRDIRV